MSLLTSFLLLIALAVFLLTALAVRNYFLIEDLTQRVSDLEQKLKNNENLS